jgi:hypothetical protein
MLERWISQLFYSLNSQPWRKRFGITRGRQKKVLSLLFSLSYERRFLVRLSFPERRHSRRGEYLAWERNLPKAKALAISVDGLGLKPLSCSEIQSADSNP